MVSFPNCKINLGLRVVSKRTDGYHDLETIFYPLPLYDILEVTTATALSFSTSGLTIEGNTASNLCIKAYELLQEDFPALPPVNIHLHKTIPTGAGLGGGSADGVFTLQALNTKYQLEIEDEQLLTYAIELGSDCPFFIINQPCFATSRGELLTRIDLSVETYSFVLVNPGININTGQMFADITPAAPTKSVKDIIQQPVETWKKELINDFEIPVFTKYPDIRSIKEELYRKGAVYASMSGSGSTVYGLFKKGSLPSFSFPPHYFVKTLVGEL